MTEGMFDLPDLADETLADPDWTVDDAPRPFRERSGTTVSVVLKGRVDTGGDISVETIRTAVEKKRPHCAALYVDSGGGSVTEGFKIYREIIRLRAAGTVFIAIVHPHVGSAATLITCVADSVLMRRGATFHVHSPYSVASRAALPLDHWKVRTMAEIYSLKTRRSEADCLADMKANLTMTAAQAVAKGYADGII